MVLLLFTRTLSLLSVFSIDLLPRADTQSPPLWSDSFLAVICVIPSGNIISFWTKSPNGCVMPVYFRTCESVVQTILNISLSFDCKLTEFITPTGFSRKSQWRLPFGALLCSRNLLDRTVLNG
ncbi:hypothetical protein B0H14DRAFT_2939928 [Mycena olivaceomarginata]|nr:hypothetical protein B0H14DRAFT_2939928 [Mycena olivaceomarginata]